MKKTFTLLLLFITMTGFSQNLWLTEKIDVKLSERFKFEFEYEDRLSDFNMVYEHTDFGISYKINENLSFNINSRLIHEFDNILSSEYRQHISFDYNLYKFGINPKFEIRFKNFETLYRFRTKLHFKQRFYKKLYLYTSDELFITNKIDGNRSVIGCMFTNSNLDLMLYYLISSEKFNMWEHENIIGISSKFSF